jgi:AcrR family transcriptional regulator
MDERPYHHGDLRRALLAAAVEAVEANGPAALSLRDLARRVGVSHAAPTHHFGDKTGLLTALAAQGHDLLADALAEAWERTNDFLEVRVAYVGFAVHHRAHFEVMFRPELLRADDDALLAARARSAALLYGPAGETAGSGSRVDAGVAAWSLMHGVAWLWLAGLLPSAAGDDPEAIARAAGRHLFSGASPRRGRPAPAATARGTRGRPASGGRGRGGTTPPPSAGP